VATARDRNRHRRGEGELLREELVAVAARLLSEAAQPADVSLRAVAHAVGVSPGAVYLWFADRNALMEAVTRVLFDELRDKLVAAAARRRTPRTRVEAMAMAYVEFALARPAAYAAMINDTDGDWGLLGRDELPGIDSLSLVEAELTQLPTVIPADRAALVLWSALHGQIQLRRGVPQLPWPSVAESVREVVALLLT
jgi:AcrR family transcriptional regulator